MLILSVFHPVDRLRHLREILDPNSPSYHPIEGQHQNIRAVIAAYEAGKITDFYLFIECIQSKDYDTI
jgi:hypothetical protein